jgi:hypothetical protein
MGQICSANTKEVTLAPSLNGIAAIQQLLSKPYEIQHLRTYYPLRLRTREFDICEMPSFFLKN